MTVAWNRWLNSESYKSFNSYSVQFKLCLVVQCMAKAIHRILFPTFAMTKGNNRRILCLDKDLSICFSFFLYFVAVRSSNLCMSVTARAPRVCTTFDDLVVVAFSSRARFSGECSTIHSPNALFFFKVEISSRTLISLFRPGLVHRSSASWDDCDRVFTDLQNRLWRFHEGEIAYCIFSVSSFSIKFKLCMVLKCIKKTTTDCFSWISLVL